MKGVIYWYCGPWQWNETEDKGSFWSPPVGCNVGLDLRSLPEQERPDGSNPGLGIFLGVVPPKKLGSNYDLLGAGDFGDIKESRKLKDMLPSQQRYRVKGDNLKRMIFDLLTDGADPLGLDYTKPLMPTRKNQLCLRLGPFEFRQNFRMGRHGHSNKVLSVIREDMEQHIEDASRGKLKDREHHRRILDMMCEKYGLKGVDDWKQFVKRNRRKAIRGRLKHETIYTDDFNRASLGSNWTGVEGAFTIYSSSEFATTQPGYSNFPCVARYESDLSSDDHYCDIDFTYAQADYSFAGPAVRFSSSAKTVYGAVYRERGSVSSIEKIISGTITTLTNTSLGTVPPANLRLESDGSSLSALVGGVEFASATDTSITGNLRCGIITHNDTANDKNSRADNFECSDLSSSSGITIVNLERDVDRGIERGLYTRYGL